MEYWGIPRNIGGKLLGKSKSEHPGNISSDIPRNMTKDTLFGFSINLLLGLRVHGLEGHPTKLDLND